jgi:hypothetical protein
MIVLKSDKSTQSRAADFASYLPAVRRQLSPFLPVRSGSNAELKQLGLDADMIVACPQYAGCCEASAFSCLGRMKHVQNTES